MSGDLFWEVRTELEAVPTKSSDLYSIHVQSKYRWRGLKALDRRQTYSKGRSKRNLNRGEEAGIAMGWQCRRQLRFLCGVPRSLELLTPFFSFLLLLSFSLSLILSGIEEGTGDHCETMRNCTWRPRLAHLFSVHFLGSSPILLSFSFSFPGIEEGTCGFEVAYSRTGLADVLALSIFSLFPALLLSPFLPALFHLRSSSTQLELKPPFFLLLFFTVFLEVFLLRPSGDRATI